jgi:hypothetical protein
MPGVDIGDQLLSYVPHSLVSKLVQKLYCHLFMLTLVQSHMLHN